MDRIKPFSAPGEQLDATSAMQLLQEAESALATEASKFKTVSDSAGKTSRAFGKPFAVLAAISGANSPSRSRKRIHQI